MWLKAMLRRLLFMILLLAVACVATPTSPGWPEGEVGTALLGWWELLESAAVVWGSWMLSQQLVKLLTALGVYETSGPRPAVEQTIHQSLSFPALCIFSTSTVQALLRQDGRVCFAGLPAEALEYFAQSCVLDALHHPDRASAYSLPHSALSIFGSSAMQHYLRSSGDHLSALTTAALDLFETSLLQQCMEEERVSCLACPHVLQSQTLGSSAAMSTNAADASTSTSPQTPLRSQSSLKRAMSGLGTFFPVLRYSSKPILTAVQPLQQPMSDPTSHLTHPIIGQGELAGEDYNHSSFTETDAGDASPTLSSGVRGALEKNTSSLAEAIQRESAAEKAAKEEADKLILEKTKKPKGLRRMSSSFKNFKIKAFRKSKDVELVNTVQEQETPAPGKKKISAKARKMAARLVPAALGGSPRAA
ncbi:MAG: hypothetical protein FRX49_13588 [Trebouxia sp. A1-2]|nr:MAG: hypothetical protein FRX49_13588 [Trebouxia sp. A1-2]